MSQPKMTTDKIDLYALSQQDYYVLEETVKENPNILSYKDVVRLSTLFLISLSTKTPFPDRMNA